MLGAAVSKCNHRWWCTSNSKWVDPSRTSSEIAGFFYSLKIPIAADEKRIILNCQSCCWGFLYSSACRADTVVCEDNPDSAYYGKLVSCWKPLYSSGVRKPCLFIPHQGTRSILEMMWTIMLWICIGVVVHNTDPLAFWEGSTLSKVSMLNLSHWYELWQWKQGCDNSSDWKSHC